MIERQKITVYEVDENGRIINVLLLDPYEINQAMDDGRIIVQHGWEERLFEPAYDLKNQEWVEGLSADEIGQRNAEIDKQESKMSDADMQALAILELATEIEKLKGGS